MPAAKVVWRIVRATFLARLEYRGEFLLQVGVGIMWQASVIVFATVILGRFPGMGGWSREAVFLIVGMRMLSHGLFELVFGRIDALVFQVQEGRIDAYLLRPMPVYRQVQLAYFPVNAIGDLGVGIVLFLNAVVRAPVDWTLGKGLFLAAALIGAVLLEAAIVTTISCAALHHPSAYAWGQWVMELIATFGNYPLSILPKFAHHLFVFVLPVAFMAYFPAAYLTGEAASPVLGLLSPLVGGLAFVAARLLWNRSLTRYSGVNG
nr:ABC-2 family transporter protein [Streptomyces sp. PTY087I2]